MSVVSVVSTYPVTGAPLERPNCVMVTGSHMTVMEAGPGPLSTWTSTGGSGRPWG